jgi:hypothetical protein
MEEVTIPQMMQKLDNYYVEEKDLQKQILKLCKQLEQVQEDYQLLELMIMHKSNKMVRQS